MVSGFFLNDSGEKQAHTHRNSEERLKVSNKGRRKSNQKRRKKNHHCRHVKISKSETVTMHAAFKVYYSLRMLWSLGTQTNWGLTTTAVLTEKRRCRAGSTNKHNKDRRDCWYPAASSLYPEATPPEECLEVVTVYAPQHHSTPKQTQINISLAESVDKVSDVYCKIKAKKGREKDKDALTSTSGSGGQKTALQTLTAVFFLLSSTIFTNDE